MDKILSVLKQVETQGSFCARLTVPTQNLHIEVDDVKVNLPLSQRKAKALIKIARPAKFGWQDQTLLDRTVRDVWAVPKSKVRIDKRAWNKTLQPLLEQFQVKLGLGESGRLKAALHNLLVYAPGQFFRPHQDSEKLDGMVATLVIILPCEHRGGDLIVDLRGEKKRFQPSRTIADQLTCIAFYADCQHEVRAVTAGYRVALTYNLVLDGATEKVRVPDKDKALASLTEALRDYFDQRLVENQSDDVPKYRALTPPKWVYLLDHEYTRKGLSWKQLKNGDQLRASLLKEAANKLDLDCYLALADIQEIWDCELDYDDRYYHSRSRRGRHWDKEDDDDDELPEEDDYLLNELIDSNTSLRHWLDAANKPIDFSELGISNSEICWTTATNDFAPFESEYEGWMGNYGNTLDRWYHRAAIVLWRKQDHYSLLCQVDPLTAVDKISLLAKETSTRPEAQRIVENMLPYWCQFRGQGDNSCCDTRVFTLALYLQSSPLAQSLVTPLGLKMLNPKMVVAFVALADAYGMAWCIDILDHWSKPDAYRQTNMIEQFPQTIKKLVKHPDKVPEIVQWLLDYQFETLKKNHALNKQRSNLVALNRESPTRINAVLDLLKGSIAASNPKFHRMVLDHVIANEALYPVLGLVSFLQRLSKQSKGKEGDWGHEKLYQYLNRQLSREINIPPRRKDDWSIRERTGCDCNDCKTLGQFLQSNILKTKTWPLAQARRGHIHSMIEGMGLPISHQTERQGSPYKLVLNKTEQLFLQEENHRLSLQKALSNLTKECAGNS